MKTNRIIFFAFLLSLFAYKVSPYAFAHTNLYRPYDINLRMADWENTSFKCGVNFEYGDTSKCRDWDENKVNVLQIFSPTESSLAMLAGAEPGSDIYEYANRFLPAFSPATDDGVRGHFKLDGKFEGWDLTFWGQYRISSENIPGKFDVFLYVPFRYLELGDVKWIDQTKSVLNADLDVKNYLTNNIHNVARDLGGLDLTSWDSFGISDIVLMLGWFKDFKQLKENLKNVRVSVGLGLTIPSATEKDEDKSFSLPLGHDGTWTVPIRLGLDLDFINRIRAGIEFEMLYMFDNTKNIRLKTDVHQTDFLLLHKGKATKSYGMTWKFNLFLQARRFIRGLSAMVAYQFVKHDDDTLTAQTNNFSYQIINTAQYLEEWGMQNFIFQLNYDFFKTCKKSWFKPQVSVFYKLPITGKRVINPHTFGAQFAVNF